jgi:hypothetical protein
VGLTREASNVPFEFKTADLNVCSNAETAGSEQKSGDEGAGAFVEVGDGIGRVAEGTIKVEVAVAGWVGVGCGVGVASRDKLHANTPIDPNRIKPKNFLFTVISLSY